MSINNKKLPVGVADFKRIIEGNYLYVDKSLFIKEVMDKGDTILLLPRPRRFGKTLNLSMLKYFYDCCPESGSDTLEGNKKLFDALAINSAGKNYMDEMGQYPVIFLSFKSIKELDWRTSYKKITKLIQKEYLKHDYLLNSPKLKPQERSYFKSITDLKAGKDDYANSLENLLIYLHRHYGKRVVILIDEYDAPIHAGFNYDYYDEIINFMRNFLSGGLKDTDQYLEKSVLTGIMRVARESIFSGLNNPGVYTLLNEEFGKQFGFTNEEVETLLNDFKLTAKYDGVQQWYNGYRFGSTTIYNPWSIINFLGSENNQLQPYWLNTSDNQVVDSLLSKGGKELKTELEQLIRGEAIEKIIDANITLKHVSSQEDVLWSFLLMGGYLKQSPIERDPVSNLMRYSLQIPNQEVKTVYVQIIKHFFSSKIENNNLEIMLNALLEGDIDVFEEIFANYVMKSMSFFDTADEPEKVYHAFAMGLFLWLSPAYHVNSNRESGYGRYDILIIPKEKSKLGFIIEFKKTRKKETLESAVQSALKQIEEKKYETELIQQGIHNYKKLAIAFQGKEVVIKEG